MYVWWPFLHWHWIFIEPYSDTFTDVKWIIIQIQWNWWKFCQGLLVRTKCENLQTWISLSSRTPHFLIAQLNTLPLIYFFFPKPSLTEGFHFVKVVISILWTDTRYQKWGIWNCWVIFGNIGTACLFTSFDSSLRRVTMVETEFGFQLKFRISCCLQWLWIKPQMVTRRL